MLLLLLMVVMLTMMTLVPPQAKLTCALVLASSTLISEDEGDGKKARAPYRLTTCGENTTRDLSPALKQRESKERAFPTLSSTEKKEPVAQIITGAR